jgi:aldehyde dehydrogenase (NAD+)
MASTSSMEADKPRIVFEAQRSNLGILKTEPTKKRIDRLVKIRDWIHKNREKIQQALKDDFAKPATETDLSEIYVVLSEIKHTLKHIRSWVRPQKVDSTVAMLGSKSYVYMEPLGVCLIISPWNFPFNLTVGPLVSALAAGNSAILKPSELTPNCSELISEMVAELFEPHEVAVFNGDKEMSLNLLNLPFDHIFFTGSPRVGKIVMEYAARNLASVTLELGGKSPVVVDSSADLEDAAEKIIWGKFINCGQTCIAPDYIMVDESVEERLLEHLGRFIEKYYNPNGEGIEASDSYARLVGDESFNRLSNLLSEALETGAELEYGGTMNPADRFMAPTIISDVKPESRIMQEEIFGPILPVISYREVSEAVDFINDKPKPLALYIFSGSDVFNKRLLNATSSGSVALNDCVIQFMNPNLPFGGVSYSGFGKSHGYSGFQAFSNQKSVVKQKTGLTSVKPLYPPYTSLTRKAVDFLLKYL